MFFNVITLLLLVQCGGKGQTMRDYNQKVYLTSKKELPTKLVDHFPNYLESDSAISTYQNFPKDNNIGFILYEFNLPSSKIDSIKLAINHKSMAKYQSNDSCLLIVSKPKSEEGGNVRKKK